MRRFRQLLLIAIRWFIIGLQILLLYPDRFFRPTKTSVIRPFDANVHSNILIFASYSARIDASIRAMIESLSGVNTYIIFCTNHHEFKSANYDLYDVFIDSRGRGFDIGQFKAASLFVLDNVPSTANVRKVIYANDSVFYLGDDGGAAISGLTDESQDFVGMFENSGRGKYHLSSWLFSLSWHIFKDSRFTDYWSNFNEISNKYWAIHAGEWGITRTALAISDRFKAIYDNDVLSHFLDKSVDFDRNDVDLLLGSHFMGDLENSNIRASDVNLYRFTSMRLFRYSPMHVFQLYMIKHCGLRFLKKDLFWNGQVDYSRLGTLRELLTELTTPDEARSIIAYFLRRGRFEDASFLRRMQSYLGISA